MLKLIFPCVLDSASIGNFFDVFAEAIHNKENSGEFVKSLFHHFGLQDMFWNRSNTDHQV